jgi:predicted PurR-regulated permease PerM
MGTPVLWGAVMAVLSLLPAFGTGLVWVPAGIYLLLTGSVWRGVVLLVFGALVISTIDNVLRPVLVSKDIEMPSYVVLVSTLGGIAVFGVNGFVIGPLLAVLFLTAWEMYLQVRGAQQDAASS